MQPLSCGEGWRVDLPGLTETVSLFRNQIAIHPGTYNAFHIEYVIPDYFDTNIIKVPC